MPNQILFHTHKKLYDTYISPIEKEHQIPDDMPKLVNEDPFGLPKNIEESIKEYQLKEAFNQIGMFGFVSWKWVLPFIDWINGRKCLEVMAGRGWLSHALRQKGVSVIATDNYSWHKGERYSNWLNTVTEVEELDAIQSVKKYGKETELLIMSWPYMDRTAYETIKTLHEIHPNAMTVYIGEGPGGCTANDAFFDHFEDINDPAFEPVIKNYQSWWGIHDCPQLGRYQKKP